MYKEYKINMSPFKCPMASQEPEIRSKNFFEVSYGYNEKTAIEEAKRCLGCPTKPCVKHCPINLDIPEFIHQVALGNFEKAYEIISKKSVLPATCGRVCSQEKQCEMKCTRGIGIDKATNKPKEAVAIGRLERFVADYYYINFKHTKKPRINKNGHKVAIIGSGPSGLACAGDLVKLGYDVTIFESSLMAGGTLIYGIPEFRLRKSIVEREIDELIELGVKIENYMTIGIKITIDELLEKHKFEAVFIGTGASEPKLLNIKGDKLAGVYSAAIYLEGININNMYEGVSQDPFDEAKRVAVIGGGNVAIDAARCAIRLGAEKVYIVYRRSMDELPANKSEIEEAIEEGVEFKTLLNPVEIIEGNTKHRVSKIKLEKQVLGEPDSSGRKRPVPTGEYEMLDVDTVVVAIGSSPSLLIKDKTPGLETNNNGYFITKNEGGLTTKKHVYAGGDAVTGPATVVHAMSAGKKAAKAIDKELSSKQ